MGTIKILSSEHGDFKHEWDPDNPESVKNAQEQFKALKKEKFRMFIVDPNANGGRGKEVTEFDPNDRALIYTKTVVATPPTVKSPIDVRQITARD